MRRNDRIASNKTIQWLIFYLYSILEIDNIIQTRKYIRVKRPLYVTYNIIYMIIPIDMLQSICINICWMLCWIKFWMLSPHLYNIVCIERTKQLQKMPFAYKETFQCQVLLIKPKFNNTLQSIWIRLTTSTLK